MIGTKLGSYEIIEELGKGGMATVYRAHQPHMERYVAVKVISKAMMEEATAKERFQREARIIARLEHPHLLPIYDFDGAYDPPYIVMRYLEGGTLKEVISGRRLPFDEITYLLRQVGSALDYAHRQGVIHRDIKPSNIMVDQEGNAFVMDFGIARMMGRDGGRDGGGDGGRNGGGLTGTGTIIGTPDYMAPEQGYGTAEIGPQADVYSLGVMLFEMIAGELPFKGKTPMETMLFHMTKEVPSAAALNPELPIELDAVLATAMAKEPMDRYPTVVEFTAEVVHVLGDAVASTPSTLQEAAQESVALIDAKREGLQEQIQATMAEFARERGISLPDTDSLVTPAEQQRTVTALYADAVEYNELVELEQGPQAARRAIMDLWDKSSKIVDDYGGSVFNRSERDLLVIWGAGTAREDDPERAIRASLAVVDEFGSHVGSLISGDEPLPIRIGINTGPVLITLDEETGSTTASGVTVNLASKVADNADGSVLITHDTYRHVQGIFDITEERPLRVRRAGGRAQVNTYRVNEVKSRAFRLQPRGIEGVDTEMVGRRAELEEIQQAFFTAIEDSEIQVVTVVGEAGMGKSRLLYEFASWTELQPERFYLFRGRATPAMSNRLNGLWRDVLSFRFEILDSDSPETVRQKMTDGVRDLIGQDDRMAHLMGWLAGFDFTGSPHIVGEPPELAEKGRREALQFFQKLTTIDPVVIQLEDLHHADEASLDLLAELTSSDEEMPLLVVAMARPKLYEMRPAWGSGQDFHIRIDLRPLNKRSSRKLAAEILQKIDDVPIELRDLLVERSEGNPHYMEELVKMLLEDKVIKKVDPEHWTVETSRLINLRVPPTLVGLLQARFDGLLYPEKLTLQRAAVVGRVFHDSALTTLDEADQSHVDDLQSVLKRLTDREFIYPRETSTFECSTEYIFGQAMMRDLILETLLEEQSAIYHKATAQWLTAQGGERVGEYDALIADHYAQAGEYMSAVKFLAKVCEAANNLGAFNDGIRAGEKGLELLKKAGAGNEQVQLRVKIEMTLADVQGFRGNYDTTKTLLESALEGARSTGDRAAEATALGHLGRLYTYIGEYQSARRHLEQAVQINKELVDNSGLMFVLRQLGNLSYITGDLAKGPVYLEQSLELARKGEDLEAMATALNTLGLITHSRGDTETALGHYREAREVSNRLGNEVITSMILTNTSHIYVENGEYEATQILVDEAYEAAADVSSQYLLQSVFATRGWIAIGTGNYQRAEENLHKALEISKTIGGTQFIVLIIGLFAWLESLVGDPLRGWKWMGVSMANKTQTEPKFVRSLDLIADNIQKNVSEEEIEAALERGAKLDLLEVMEVILGEEKADLGVAD